MLRGNNSTVAVLDAFANVGLDYVAIDGVDIDNIESSKEELWADLTRYLRDVLAARRVEHRPPGRPAKGPGSAQLGGTEADRLSMVRVAYDDITNKVGRPAQYAEVARRLAISTTTLWRIRQGHDWPPETGFP